MKINALKAIVCLAPLSVFLTVAWLYYRSFNHGMEIIDMGDLHKVALTQFLEPAKHIATLAVGVMGALWVSCAIERKVVLRGGMNLWLFLYGQFFLLFTMISYWAGTRLVATRLFHHESVDISAPIIRYWHTLEVVSFGLGVICSALAILLRTRKVEV